MIERLSGRRRFAGLRAEGRTARGALLAIRFQPTTDHVRVAYAISRSVGNAVQRNRVRRRLRAVFEMMARNDDGRLRPGNYLVRVENTAVGASFDALRDDVRAVVDQLMVTSP